jgi:hypothetical protein
MRLSRNPLPRTLGIFDVLDAPECSRCMAVLVE